MDCNLHACFDRINHDLLMIRLRRQSDDDGLLKLIDSYLRAGVRSQGKRIASAQGDPPWPVLSDILQNDLDWKRRRRSDSKYEYCWRKLQ